MCTQFRAPPPPPRINPRHLPEPCICGAEKDLEIKRLAVHKDFSSRARSRGYELEEEEEEGWKGLEQAG